MAIAITLSAQRNGRAAMLPQNICTREKGASSVSFIRRIRLALHRCFPAVQSSEPSPMSTNRAECHFQYFYLVKFSTHVLISLWKSPPRPRLTTRFSVCWTVLHYFGANIFLPPLLRRGHAPQSHE